MKNYSISDLARRCGLSRSTLLYYSRIGLLHPCGRSAANYRFYGERELERLQEICRLRRTGLPLADIASILDTDQHLAPSILRRRLAQIAHEIRQLQIQQRITLTLLHHPDLGRQEAAVMLTRERWTAMLAAAGLDDEGMHRWHFEFEKSAPEAHHHFLLSLGIAEEVAGRIRSWSRTWQPTGQEAVRL
jgi:DNA-binding transcriptional MerR regulator